MMSKRNLLDLKLRNVSVCCLVLVVRNFSLHSENYSTNIDKTDKVFGSLNWLDMSHIASIAIASNNYPLCRLFNVLTAFHE